MRVLTWDEAADLGYINCLLDGSRGRYLPKAFTNSCNLKDWKVDHLTEQLDDLREGPDAEHYDESWADVCDEAEYVDDEGREWHLWQDDDLFAVCSSDENGVVLDIDHFG